jgi:lipopolysaccharide biosynthesis glycosyltransferase
MSTEIVIATAADNKFVIPLAVTVRSVLDTLAEGSRVQLYVLDGGITPENRARLESSWNDPRLSVEWRQQNMAEFETMPLDGHVTAATYLRLRLAHLLPESVGRVIYMDADMLARHDLTELWNEPQGDAPVQAVQDCAAPWIDAEITASNFEQMQPFLAAWRPISNYKELGLRPAAPYFNAGMMVVDLDRWRREGATEKLMQCVRDNAEYVLWWDQYVLNVVFCDRWRQLDLRWNLGAHLSIYPSWKNSPLSKEQFAQLKDDPWIVHFCSPVKPWHDGCRHPYTAAFFETLDRTEWRGWRPEPAPEIRLQIAKERRRMLKRSLRSSLRSMVSSLWRKAS